jgi:hypothetical protein
MRVRFAVVGAMLALSVAAFTAVTATAAPAAKQQSLSVPITAAPTSMGTLNGVFAITNFATNAAGQLVANGTFTGTLTDAGGVVTQVTDTVSSVITPAATTAGCQVLDLTLGPLHLDLLGLVVDLNRVHLNITAQPGPGNLLGNLLCAVTHLLDGPGANAGLANLLNRINGLLG